MSFDQLVMHFFQNHFVQDILQVDIEYDWRGSDCYDVNVCPTINCFSLMIEGLAIVGLGVLFDFLLFIEQIKFWMFTFKQNNYNLYGITIVPIILYETLFYILICMRGVSQAFTNPTVKSFLTPMTKTVATVVERTGMVNQSSLFGDTMLHDVASYNDADDDHNCYQHCMYTLGFGLDQLENTDDYVDVNNDIYDNYYNYYGGAYVCSIFVILQFFWLIYRLNKIIQTKKTYGYKFKRVLIADIVTLVMFLVCLYWFGIDLVELHYYSKIGLLVLSPQIICNFQYKLNGNDTNNNYNEIMFSTSKVLLLNLFVVICQEIGAIMVIYRHSKYVFDELNLFDEIKYYPGIWFSIIAVIILMWQKRTF